MNRSRLVPRSVIGAGFSAVIPACVLFAAEACSSGPVLGVAAVAFCCFEAGVADAFTDASDATSDTTTDSPKDSPSDAPKDAPSDGPEGG